MLAEQTLNIEKIRKDFPMLQRQMNGKPLVYLDNAATTQKPNCVIDKMTDFYRNAYATVHRGVYSLSQESTTMCDQVRQLCQRFLNAKKIQEIVFTRGSTEAINMVASGFAKKYFKQGDEILISNIEHHANIVPWQRVCLEKGVVLKIVPVNDQGEIIMEEYRKLLSSRTKLVAVNHISNALGTVNPIKEMIDAAHQKGALVLIDGAQGVSHTKVDVQALDCDFYCFSGHKIYGPTGIGVLYGKYELLEAMDPHEFGGDMIESVSFQETKYAKPPRKFESGTPAFVEIIGLGPAIEYVQALGFDKIHAHEQSLLEYTTKKILEIEGIRIIGTAKEKASVISFVSEFAHPHDIGTILDQEGIAIRTGQHCAQPTMERFGVPATARASFGLYNTKEEADVLINALKKVKEIFQ